MLLVPVIAGVSFEIIRLAGRSDNPLVNALSKPGLALQKLTTREPDAAQAEVAIAAVEAVFDWKAYLRGKFRVLRQRSFLRGGERNSFRPGWLGPAAAAALLKSAGIQPPLICGSGESPMRRRTPGS